MLRFHSIAVLATFPVLSNCMWLVAAILDSTNKWSISTITQTSIGEHYSSLYPCFSKWGLGKKALELPGACRDQSLGPHPSPNEPEPAF